MNVYTTKDFLATESQMLAALGFDLSYVQPHCVISTLAELSPAIFLGRRAIVTRAIGYLRTAMMHFRFVGIPSYHLACGCLKLAATVDGIDLHVSIFFVPSHPRRLLDLVFVGRPQFQEHDSSLEWIVANLAQTCGVANYATHYGLTTPPVSPKRCGQK